MFIWNSNSNTLPRRLWYWPTVFFATFSMRFPSRKKKILRASLNFYVFRVALVGGMSVLVIWLYSVQTFDALQTLLKYIFCNFFPPCWVSDNHLKHLFGIFPVRTSPGTHVMLPGYFNFFRWQFIIQQSATHSTPYDVIYRQCRKISHCDTCSTLAQ